MEAMRDLLRGHLSASLQAMGTLDRLLAAWPVVCGTAMARHGQIVAYEDGAVLVAVPEEDWRRQMLTMRQQIASDLGRVAGVRVCAIHFERDASAEGDAGWSRRKP